jgi:long-chain fatty acid transport protein
MQIASRHTFTALALGIAGVLAFGSADASGFQIRENSVKNMGRANAGTTVAWGDASVVLNNPAAMANLDKTTLQADVTVIDLTADFDGTGTSAVGSPLHGGNGGDPGEATPVPAIAAVFPLSGSLDNVTLGASISAPFGLKTEYDPSWIGRYNAITSDVKTIDLTLSAAIAFSEKLSVGVGVIYQHADVTLSNAVDFGTQLCALSAPVVPGVSNCAIPAYPFHPESSDALATVKGDDNDWGFVFGVQFRPTDNVAIGYAHRSEIHHTLTGNATFDHSDPRVPATFAALGVHSFDNGPIWANLDTPATDTVSVLWNVNDSFRVMADAQLTGWSSLEAVDIYRHGGAPLAHEPFNWDDTMFYSLGGEWDLSDAFTLRAGVGFDETPTNDAARTPRLPDNDRTVFTLGMTWNVSEALSVDAAYMRVQIDTPSINATSSSGSHLVGDFDGHADLLGVSAQYRF